MYFARIPGGEKQTVFLTI